MLGVYLLSGHSLLVPGEGRGTPVEQGRWVGTGTLMAYGRWWDGRGINKMYRTQMRESFLKGGRQ